MIGELMYPALKSAPVPIDAAFNVTPTSSHLCDKGILCARFKSNEQGGCPLTNCPYAHIPAAFRRRLPTMVCHFYINARCLRENCQFFHGPRKLFDQLKDQGAVDYAPSDYMPPRDPLAELSPTEVGMAASKLALNMFGLTDQTSRPPVGARQQPLVSRVPPPPPPPHSFPPPPPPYFVPTTANFAPPPPPPPPVLPQPQPVGMSSPYALSTAPGGGPPPQQPSFVWMPAPPSSGQLPTYHQSVVPPPPHHLPSPSAAGSFMPQMMWMPGGTQPQMILIPHQHQHQHQQQQQLSLPSYQ